MECNNYNESRDWQGEKYDLQTDKSDESNWKDGPINQEERTPVKDCGDLTYHVNHEKIDYSKEVPEESSGASSKTKRRRILQFESEARDSSLHCEETSPTLFTSNISEDFLSEDSLELPSWLTGCSEDPDASNCDGMEPASEGWLEQYLNSDLEINFDTDELTFPSISDIHIDVSEFCNEKPEHEAAVAPKHVRPTSSNIIFREFSTTSYLRAPTKKASSVTCPFSFIKPSEAHGDVTLMDINQRICTPPPPKSKHCDEETSAIYPISAITGKPVVKQTHIRTEGGKGCITFRRTKG